MGGYFTETPDGTVISVKAQPRSSKSGIEGLLGDAVKVRIRCAPVDGNNVMLTLVPQEGNQAVWFDAVTLASNAGKDFQLVFPNGTFSSIPNKIGSMCFASS